MDQTVSHSGHFSPGGLGILRADLFWDIFCRFTDDFNETDDASAAERIG